MTDNNRIIKFRGRAYCKGWIYGSLIQAVDGFFILEEGIAIRFLEPAYHSVEEALAYCSHFHPEFIEIDPKTVGQFTGWADKFETDIYEGDIVEPNPVHVTCNCEVVFEESGWKLRTIPHNQTHLLRGEIWKQSKVIGNIYETFGLISQ
jgi:hypothetical protein